MKFLMKILIRKLTVPINDNYIVIIVLDWSAYASLTHWSHGLLYFCSKHSSSIRKLTNKGSNSFFEE